jgi:HEAT repeat protein
LFPVIARYTKCSKFRALTAQSLGMIGNPDAVDALILATRDANPEVRIWTVWALDEIDGKDR